jgi:rubrerythrin
MDRKRAIETSKGFVTRIREWQALEERAISSARGLIAKTNNPLIKMTMELIAHDSEKHRLVQQMIIDSLTREAVHVSPDELGALLDGLNRHVEAEKEALCFAEKALCESELFVTRFLLSYLVEDEKKHHNLLCQLEDFKRNQIESSTSARA